MTTRTEPFMGIQYLRPPNPPKEYWDADLKRIAEMGFTTIRTWLYWRSVEPEQGHWDFSAYDQLFALARKYSLIVQVTLITEVPPEWAIKQLPDSLLVRPNGSTFEIVQNQGSMAIGGYPGFCLDEPRAKELAAKFITASARHFENDPALQGFDLQNEIQPFYGLTETHVNHPCQQDMFHDFLLRRYGTIEKYNELHLTSLSSFEDAKMLLHGLPADGMDRIFFCAERIFSQLEWRRDIVRQQAPNAAIFCHTGGIAASVTSRPWVLEDLAALVDSWGTAQYESNFWMQLLSAVITRSAAAGKPWGIVELPSGTMWTHYPTTARTPAEAVSAPLLFISLGATTTLFWQYRPERYGSEAPNFGFIMENGQVPRRAQAVSNLMDAVKQNAHLIYELSWPTPEIAVVVDWHGFAYEEGVGASAQSPRRIEELAGIVGGFSLAGYEVSTLSSTQWERVGLPSEIRLLVLPNNIVLSDQMIQRLEEATQSGVSILAGPMTGHFTEYGWLRNEAGLKRLEAIFGSARFDVEVSSIVRLYSNQQCVTGLNFCEHYVLEGADPWLIGESGNVCGTQFAPNESIRMRYGSHIGRSLVGNAPHPFLADTAGPAATTPPVDPAEAGSDLPALLDEVARNAGLLPVHPSETGFTLRVGRKGEQRVAFIRNVADQPRQFNLKKECWPVKALDGGSLPEVEGTPITFAPHETRVFLL
jgi:beta-galactosidase GanA